MSKRKMPLNEACELVPDDLPDGAYWAMAHDIAGAEYGNAWHELDDTPQPKAQPREKTLACPICPKKFTNEDARRQHMVAHGDKTIPCSTCKRKFRETPHLIAHVTRAHPKKQQSRKTHERV